MKLAYLSCLIGLVLTSCGSDESESSNNKPGASTKEGQPEEITVPQDDLDKTLPQLQSVLGDQLESALGDSSPKTQAFKIDPKANNTLTTTSGVIIQIPANAFEGAGSSVDIYIKELFSPMDAILSGMQTISDKGILASDGMLFIDAQSDGSSLQMANDKSIMMALPSRDTRNKDYKVFEGGNSNPNELIWKESKGKMQDYIIPFPPQYLLNGVIDYYEDELGNYRDKILYYHVSPELKDKPEVSKYNWWYYEDLDKYKNSLVVTREFASMFESTAGISSHDEVTAFYLEKTNLPLWQVDSMYWPEYEFKDRKHGKVIKLDYEGIDLNENGYEKLAKEGLSDEDIQVTMFYHQQRERIMKDMDDQANARKVANYNSIMLRSLGWINIDRYVELKGDPLLVNITVENGSKNTQVYAVNEDDKIILRANRDENGTFFFGKTPEEKVKIPLPAVIYSFDVIDGQFHFYLTQPQWYSEEPISIKLGAISKEEVKEFFDFIKD